MKPNVDSHLRHLDYDWYQRTPEQVAKDIQKVLEKADEIWEMPVYASNDGLYTSIEAQFPEFTIYIRIDDVPSLDKKARRLSFTAVKTFR